MTFPNHHVIEASKVYRLHSALHVTSFGGEKSAYSRHPCHSMTSRWLGRSQITTEKRWSFLSVILKQLLSDYTIVPRETGHSRKPDCWGFWATSTALKGMDRPHSCRNVIPTLVSLATSHDGYPRYRAPILTVYEMMVRVKNSDNLLVSPRDW
ncbi:hypothetical protein LY76DRAFT_340599 [Colletotrichum caudatum]|nr:hypothetical protein LY76DRAFT_340599 [Colletotrichum caudatum]